MQPVYFPFSILLLMDQAPAAHTPLAQVQLLRVPLALLGQHGTAQQEAHVVQQPLPGHQCVPLVGHECVEGAVGYPAVLETEHIPESRPGSSHPSYALRPAQFLPLMPMGVVAAPGRTGSAHSPQLCPQPSCPPAQALRGSGCQPHN